MPDLDFVSGTAISLASAIRRIPAGRGDPDRIAARLDKTLTLAANLPSGRDKKLLAMAMNLPVSQVVDGKKVDRTQAATVRALLVITAAAMFHARLDQTLPLEAPEIDARDGTPYAGSWPPKRLSACHEQEDIEEALKEAWQTILALDYKPVFDSGIKALTTPPVSDNWRSCLRLVAMEAHSVAADAAASGHDLLGRIFHRLLDTARYDGSFYTSVSSAVLLAGLSIGPESLPENITDLKVIDPACGTGTLLMAVAERIRELDPASKNGQDTSAAALIEDVIWGLDVNVTACHMAATALGLLSPSTAFKRMNLHLMDFGKVGHISAKRGKPPGPDVRVGSLELLDEAGAITGQQRLGSIWSSGEHIDTKARSEIPPNSFDLVIMNPPFTRDSLRHDQFDDDVEEAMKDREKKLMNNRHGHGSSSGTMFLDLGEHLTSMEPGATLATVLPSATAAAPSAAKVRKMLGEWFYIEWVVYSHDPNRQCFSENTGISEMLVVARRHPNPAEADPTQFLCLRKNPPTAATSAAILDSIRDGSPPLEWGRISEWPAEEMQKGRWQPLAIYSPYLASLYQRISCSELFAVQQLSTIADIGPAGRRIRDAYKPHEHADHQARRALWHNDSTIHQTVLSDTDTYAHARPSDAEAENNQIRNPEMADKYWDQRGCLFLPASLRLNKGILAATCTQTATIGSQWEVVRPHETFPAKLGISTIDKALAVWFNCTLGVVTILGNASPKVLSRPALSLTAIRSLPVPIMTKEQMEVLASVFDLHALNPLAQFRDAASDSVRQTFDETVADLLSISFADMTLARQELAAEPSVQ